MAFEQIKVIVIEPHQRPTTREITNSLNEMHKIVDGFIDGSDLEEDVVIVFDEDAKANNKDGNRRFGDEVFAGTIIIARWDIEQRKFQSLSDHQIEEYSRMFYEPEKISEQEVMEALAMEQSI